MSDSHHPLQVSTVKPSQVTLGPLSRGSGTEEVQAYCSKKWALRVRDVANKERKGRCI